MDRLSKLSVQFRDICSVHICSSITSNFLDLGDVMPVVLGLIKMSLWYQKRPAMIFEKAKDAIVFGKWTKKNYLTLYDTA